MDIGDRTLYTTTLPCERKKTCHKTRLKMAFRSRGHYGLRSQDSSCLIGTEMDVVRTEMDKKAFSYAAPVDPYG